MTLKSEFQLLRHRYFPRWIAAATWTIRCGPRARWRRGNELRTTDEMGYCDSVTHTIWVRWAAPSAARTQTLLHEMCHAVTRGGHGQQWQQRMLRVAERAAPLSPSAGRKKPRMPSAVWA